MFLSSRFFILIWLFAASVILIPGGAAMAQQSSTEDQSGQRFYSIEGEVQKPGRFPLAKDLRVKGAIEAAGGLTGNADRKRSEIFRFNKRQKIHYTIYLQVDSALAGDPTDNFVLLDQDRIIIHSVRERISQAQRLSKPEPTAEPEKMKKEIVSTAGEIVKPGAYEYKEGMTVSDLVYKSGGTLETSCPEQAEIVSPTPETGQQVPANGKTINLKKAMEQDPAHNLTLRPDDRLVVKRIPDSDKPLPRVRLSGEISLPGQYPIAKGERLFSVLERAGGFMRDANPRGAVVTKERVRNSQQTILEEIGTRIEREHSGSGKYKDATQRLLQQIKTSKANGRVKAAVTSADMLRDEVYDIEMEDGDTFHVPTLLDTVRVTGAVKKEGSYDHNGQSDYRDYIEAAGGYTATADEAAVFVVKVDGSAQQVGKAFVEWRTKRKRLEIGGSKYTNRIIEPGDVIVVPELIVHPAWLREIRDNILLLMYNGVIAPNDLKK